MSEANGAEAGVVGFSELHPQDVIGELCDAWVGAGDRFVQYADGSYERVVHKPEAVIPHDPYYVEAVIDKDGRTVTSVTPTTFSRYVGYPDLITGVMAHAPPEYLVHQLVPDQRFPRSHRVVAEPVGINVNHIPGVRPIVEQAFTRLPRSGRYPEGALVLRESDQYYLLNFFDRVLTPPAEPIPVTAPVSVIEQPVVPAKKAAPATLQPAERPRNRETLIFEGASYLFALIAGGAGLATIENFQHHGAKDFDTGASAVIFALCALEAVLTYCYGREERR